nr:MAG TPA: hypothetical protein [Caudoviricetes sp.]
MVAGEIPLIGKDLLLFIFNRIQDEEIVYSHMKI